MQRQADATSVGYCVSVDEKKTSQPLNDVVKTTADKRKGAAMNKDHAVQQAQARRYEKPTLEVLGRLEDLTQVGLTKPGPDTFPGRSDEQHDGGSICPQPSFCPGV
jgi:hypothetical protein